MNYEGYKWVKVSHHKYDPAKSWEENYRDLEKHHVAETTFLIEEIRKLAAKKADVSLPSDLATEKPE